MSKLSDELNQFSKDLQKLPPTERDAVYAAIRKSMGPIKSQRKTGEGMIPTRDVDMAVIDEAIPTELRVDWRQIQRSLNEAIRKHGEQWAAESIAYILNKYLLPQPTAGEVLLAGTPGLVEAIAKAIPGKLPPPPPPTVDMEKLADMVFARLKAEAQKPAA